MEQNRWKQAALALFAMAALACNESGVSPAEESQIVSGRVARHNFAAEVIGVRAVSGDSAMAWSAVALDGSFSLELPAGAAYRMEVVTAAGTHGFVASADGATRALSFEVCSAGAPFDVGHVHGWAQSGDEKPGDDCGDPPPPCDAAGNCCFDDGTCCAPGEPCEPPPCKPGPDGNCDPGTPPCDPATGENCCDDPAEDGSCPGQPCEPGPDGTCDDPTSPCEAGDPNCCENPAPDGSCPGQPCEPGPDGNCDDPTTPPCEPGPDGNCDQPPTPCDDYDDPSCWPQPGTPPCAGVPDAEGGAACWSDGAVPEKLIPDFGCG